MENKKQNTLGIIILGILVCLGTGLYAVITDGASSQAPVSEEEIKYLMVPGSETIHFNFFATTLGKFRVVVPKQYTVGDLKQLIQEKYHVPAKDQHVWFDNVEQVNSASLKKAVNGNKSIIMTTELVMPKTISFILYSPVIGHQKRVVPSNWTVGDLKRDIEQNYNIAFDDQVILFGSSSKEEADAKLLSTAVKKGLDILMTTKKIYCSH